MTFTLSIPSMTPAEIISAIVAIASIVYAFSKNASGIKNDVINAYEKRVKQLETDVCDLVRQVQEVKEMLNKRESELKIVTELLQGRNPEFTLFLSRTTMMLESLMQNFKLPLPAKN